MLKECHKIPSDLIACGYLEDKLLSNMEINGKISTGGKTELVKI